MTSRFCAACVLTLLIAAACRGQGKTKDADDPPSVNPIYNRFESGQQYAWVARNEHPNNHPQANRQAIQIVFKGQTSDEKMSDRNFTGTLSTYKIQGGGNQRKYKRVLHEVSLVGVSDTPPGSPRSRKRIRFTATGTYVENEEMHVVLIKGSYRPGNNGKVHGQPAAGKPHPRQDDRLIVRITFDPSKGKADKSAAVESSFVFVAMQNNDPCDESPDDDILEEEPYVEMDDELVYEEEEDP